jgi:phosphopantetheine--protein transferase-like protein
MVVGIGLDIVEVARIAKALRGSKSITERVFTPEEIRYCSRRRNNTSISPGDSQPKRRP